MTIDDYRKNRKVNQPNHNRYVLKSNVKNFVNRFLVAIIILLCALIITKRNPEYAKKISKYVYQENIHFSRFKQIYNKYFGKYIGESTEEKPVFSETIAYNNESVYKDGVKLEVTENYLVPAIQGGIVVFIGEKEGYGQTVIIEQIDGVNAWYSNVNVKDIKLYDYVKKGDLIAEAKTNNIYLLFEEKGKFIDYKKYI